MKLMRFLLGLAIGAGVALLVAPKSGRELRQQLAGGASGKLLGAAPDEYPQPEPVAEWGGAATVVAEAPWSWKPSLGRQSRWSTRSSGVEEAVEPPAPFPAWDDQAETPASDDLRARIDETRAALENELAQPFADAAAEHADEAAPLPTTPSWTR